MDRVALLVKHFPTSNRISGLTSFAVVLADQLARHCDLHVISCKSKEPTTSNGEQHAFHHHTVPAPFWARVARAVNLLQVDKVIVLSGVHKARFLQAAFKLLFSGLPDHVPLHFYQGTVLDRPPSKRLGGLFGRCSSLLCTNRRLARMLSDSLQQKCVYLPPGIDLQNIQNTEAAPKNGKLRVGFFNHFAKRKGADLALEAFSRLPFEDTEYVASGAGPLATRLRKQYSGSENISLTGPSQDHLARMKSCDFLVFPFRTSVSVLGISQTVLEAFAAGIPVIGSATDVITSAVTHGKQGLIFDDETGFSDCIIQMHDDHELRERMSQCALQEAKQYCIKSIARQLHDLTERE